MRERYNPAFRFVLKDETTGKFPKVDHSVISRKLLTTTLSETYIFDDRDDPEGKLGYYNILYRGIAVFTVFTF